MNASSWRKAADLIAQGAQATQQIQAAATSDSSQLESLPLTSLAANDSGPPQVNYGKIKLSQNKGEKPNKDKSDALLGDPIVNTKKNTKMATAKG